MHSDIERQEAQDRIVVNEIAVPTSTIFRMPQFSSNIFILRDPWRLFEPQNHHRRTHQPGRNDTSQYHLSVHEVTILKNGLLFSGESRNIWLSKRRSIRIEGVATSLRLELFFWQSLEGMAAANNCSLSELITELFRGYRATPSATTGFASYVRVCISRQLELVVEQEVSSSRRNIHRRIEHTS